MKVRMHVNDAWLEPETESDHDFCRNLLVNGVKIVDVAAIKPVSIGFSRQPDADAGLIAVAIGAKGVKP